jgi:hypothetical protein
MVGFVSAEPAIMPSINGSMSSAVDAATAPLFLGFLNIFQFEDKEEAVWLLVGVRWHEVELVLVEYLGRSWRSHLAVLDAVARGVAKLDQVASHVGIKIAHTRRV